MLGLFLVIWRSCMYYQNSFTRGGGNLKKRKGKRKKKQKTTALQPEAAPARAAHIFCGYSSPASKTKEQQEWEKKNSCLFQRQYRMIESSLQMLGNSSHSGKKPTISLSCKPKVKQPGLLPSLCRQVHTVVVSWDSYARGAELNQSLGHQTNIFIYFPHNCPSFISV